VFEATPELIRVAASGDLAYLVGRKREVCKGSGGNVASEGKVLSVWEKRDGTWKIVALSARNNAPTSRGCL
jgi:ketosteroid isomerase-like protein